MQDHKTMRLYTKQRSCSTHKTFYKNPVTLKVRLGRQPEQTATPKFTNKRHVCRNTNTPTPVRRAAMRGLQINNNSNKSNKSEDSKCQESRQAKA